MAGQSTDSLSPLDLLERISDRVASLDPPVAAFERGIRSSPFRILISVLLSSRTRDPVTLAASGRLFALADTPASMSGLSVGEVEAAIYPVGFYRDKARRILEISQTLAQDKGEIPRDPQRLMALPGVGRKTANLVLSLAFGIPAIAVDIHVYRISRRLGWAAGDNPDQVETELKGIFPRASWNRVNQVLVGFGQTLCRPRNPLCVECPVSSHCAHYARDGR